MKRAEVSAATSAFQAHRVEWFPPDPPNCRNPIYLCMGCGWRAELDGYADESNSGLEHRIEAALHEVGLTPTNPEEQP